VVRSQTIGRVCRLQLLLALASVVILGSKSLGTRDHILLSQIRDFLLRPLLRLAGLRWRYLTPPPHDWITSIVSRRIHRKNIRCPVSDIFEPHRKRLFLYCCIYSALHSNGYPSLAYVFVATEMCLPSRCPATCLRVTTFIPAGVSLMLEAKLNCIKSVLELKQGALVFH
jgi:hypothetical protein